MKRGGGLLPARPDCWPPTKRPQATPVGLIAASVTCLSRREGVPPCLRTSRPLGGTLEVHRTSWRIPFPRHACTFLVLGFRGAWVSHAPPRVPKQRRPQDAALPPGSGSRLAGSPAWHGLPQCPGCGHCVSYCCAAFVFGSGWRLGVGFVNPASPGWGLGWVCLGTVCGVVPLVSAVCGVRGWASVSACFWDVCGFVGAPLAPRRFRFRRAVWACVLGPGLGCAQPFFAGLSGCVFCAFFFFFFSCPRLCGPCPSIFFLSGWAGGSLFFFPFRCPFSPWAAVTGLVVPVLGGWSPCASVGVLSSVPSGGGFGRLWWCWRAVWRLWAVFVPFPPPPSFFFFFGGGGLACSSLCLPWAGARTGAFSVVFRAAVFSCVLCGRVPAPWVGWAMYTVGSAPLPAGLGLGSACWAAAPGGCLWFWVRGLGLFVSFPLRGAGCNLLGGPPPLSPGALWPRVWPALLVCGVLARRLPGCAVAGCG